MGANRTETLGVTGWDHGQTELGFTREPPLKINGIQVPEHLGPDPNANVVLGPKTMILTIFMGRVFLKGFRTRFQLFKELNEEWISPGTKTAIL